MTRNLANLMSVLPIKSYWKAEHAHIVTHSQEHKRMEKVAAPINVQSFKN